MARCTHWAAPLSKDGYRIREAVKEPKTCWYALELLFVRLSIVAEVGQRSLLKLYAEGLLWNSSYFGYL